MTLLYNENDDREGRNDLISNMNVADSSVKTAINFGS